MTSEKMFVAIPREQAEIINDMIDYWDAWCICANDKVMKSKKRCPIHRLVELGKIRELRELKGSHSHEKVKQ